MRSRGPFAASSIAGRSRVFVDPEDFQLVAAAIDELKAKLGGGEICDVQADRRIGRGGVIVRTVEREVDATVGTQLERAREVILAELGGRGGRAVSGRCAERASRCAPRRGPGPQPRAGRAI